jgi:prepilin-type N-terminal cleavage/methylation domain-containing protein
MQVQEKNIRGFNLLELLVVIVIISVISAAAYPNFSSWKKEREVRSAAVKIKNLISNINSQVQRGHYAFVQVEVIATSEEVDGKDELIVTSKGLHMDSFVNNMREVDEWKTDFSVRCAGGATSTIGWDDDGSSSDKLEVAQIKFEDIVVNFEDDYGTVCFSKDGTYYSGDSEFEVDSGFWICSRSLTIKKCKAQEESGNPSAIHDNIFEVSWSRFGNVILEKWSKSKTDKLGSTWVLQ